MTSTTSWLFSFSQPLTTTKPFQVPPVLTSIAQDGRPGLTIGHQALGSLVWVGESRGQAWGEYNTNRDMNYCGGGGGLQTTDLGIWPESGAETFFRGQWDIETGVLA